MNETLGRVHFWMMTPSFFVLTFGMMRIGLLGMRRRIVDYDPALGFDTTHLILTIAGFMIALSVLIFIYNFFNSIKNGEKAEGNIWGSRSPEWQVPSPMPAHNYDQPFEVDSVSRTITVCPVQNTLNLCLHRARSINRGGVK